MGSARGGSPETERLCWGLLEHGPFGALLLSADARLVAANETYCRMVGKSREQLRGAEVFSILPADRREAFRAQWQALLASPGGSDTFELCIAGPTGPRWLECEAINLIDDPRVGGVLGSCKDITARKAIELSARESQARLNFLLSATDAVTYSARPNDFGTSFISERVLEMVGYTAKEFVDDTSVWLDNVHPDDREQIFAAFPQFLEQGHHSFEYRFRHKDGAYRWVHDSARVVKDEHGKPVEIIGYWVDITEKKETELALKRSEETFRALVENLPTAALINRGLKILYANPAMVRMLGYASLDEFLERDMLSMIHPDDHPAILARIERMTAGAPSPPLERTAIRKDGTTLVVEGEGFPLPLDGGAYVVLFRDLTERKEMLARMAVADRMVSVGMLAAGVAHELNTPLAYVGANLAMLAESMPRLLSSQSSRVPREQVASLLEDCQDGLERMVGVVRDLRTLSQAEEGKRVRVDVRSTIQAAIKMAHTEIRHRARLEEHYDDDLFVLASEGRLVQLVLNLLLNAAQAIPEGAIDQHQIRISAVRKAGAVTIEIADTGEGIAPEKLPRIFDPFFTTKPDGLGTGLGLPICQGIVRNYGGTISIRSKVKQGTTVTVELPSAGEAGKASGDERPRLERAREARILVLDDELRFGATLKLLLAPNDVLPLVDPREALTRIGGGERFDVILCDLMIPSMNGMDFYSQLLRLDPAATRRIIFLTGGAFTQRSKEFLESVPNLCLEKPASERVLREAIDAIVAGQQDAN